MSISAWVYARSLGEAGAGRITQKSSSTLPQGDGWGLSIASANALNFGVDYSTTDLSRRSSTAVTLNTWRHILITWDGSATASNVKMYLNGVEVFYGTTTNGAGSRNSDASRSLFIGNEPGGTRTFDGFIDEVRVYNRVLSQDEIKRLYNMGR